MMSGVVDVNVWLALLVKEHIHHPAARRWFDKLDPGEAGLCRIVQLALLRLLGNQSIMGPGALSVSRAWTCIADLMEDERVAFLPEPSELSSVMPGLLQYPVPTPSLVTDAYLAAFAIALDAPLVSWDRGFRQFQGLRLQLLRA